MKKILTAALFSCLTISAFSQLDPFFSQSIFNRLNLNPAYAGMDGTINASVIGRDQLNTTLPLSPPELMFNGDVNLPCINSGIGLTASSHNYVGIINDGLKLSYSYHVKLGNGMLGLGTSIGYYHSAFPYELAAQPNGAWNESTAVINTYDVSLGIYYATEQGFYFGVSANDLPQIKTSNVQVYASNTPIRNYTVMSGNVNSICSHWDILEDASIQSSSQYTIAQISLRAEYNKTAWFGLGYRTDESTILMAGFNFYCKNGSCIKVGYSHDFYQADINDVSAINELLIQCVIKQKPKEKPADAVTN